MTTWFNDPLEDVNDTFMMPFGKFSLSNTTEIFTSSPALASSGSKVAVIVTILSTTAFVFASSLLPHQLFSAVTEPPAKLIAYLVSPSFVNMIESEMFKVPAPM